MRGDHERTLQYHLTVRLVLASGSPRRAALLSAACVPFHVEPVDVDESAHVGEPPESYVRRLALAKSEAAGPPDLDTVILTADTIVAVDGLLLGKPNDDRDAARMLRRLSGRTHRVLTAIVLSHAGGRLEDLAVTNVTFHSLSEEAISWYLASGEHHDKAGAYAIQGRASRFIARLDGSYTNVVGLPVDLVCRHLETLAPALLALD
jgi:septum formation protein